MADANPKKDALKLAIDDFVEREARVREEVEAAEAQIRQLEAQIEGANERLGHVGDDRQKIMEITNRYVSTQPQAEPQAKGKAESKAEPAKPEPAKQAASAGPVIKPPPPKPAKPAGAEPAKEGEAKDDAKAEGDDDTVKNINDALRGLFR